MPIDPLKAELFNRLGRGVVHMGVFDVLPVSVLSEGYMRIISTFSVESLGVPLSVWGEANPSSIAFVSANTAFFVPVVLPSRVRVYAFFRVNGSTVSGNIDMALYDSTGLRIRSTGSVAQSGVAARQLVSVVPFEVGPGLYYLADVADNSTGTLVVKLGLPTGAIGSIGVMTQASAFPLPLQAVFSVSTFTVVPLVGMLCTMLD